MLKRTAYIQWERLYLRSLLEAHLDDEGAGGLLLGLLAKFYKDNVEPSGSSLLAGFGDIASLGTAGLAVEWIAPIIAPDTEGWTLKAQVEVVAESGFTPETISGIVIVNAGATLYRAACLFDEPVEIAQIGDGISVDIVGSIPWRWESGYAAA